MSANGAPAAELLAVLEPLLDQALELAPAGRGPWLARVGSVHPELARELESLLAAEGGWTRADFWTARSAALC